MRTLFLSSRKMVGVLNLRLRLILEICKMKGKVDS